MLINAATYYLNQEHEKKLQEDVTDSLMAKCQEAMLTVQIRAKSINDVSSSLWISHFPHVLSVGLWVRVTGKKRRH